MREAKTYQVRCDWPGCGVVVDIDQADYYNPVDGWTQFRGGFQVVNGFWLSDLCPLHRNFTLSQVADEAELKKAER